jgi:hypothetical protein
MMEDRMNIKLGAYEIFSRIIPGGVYLAAIGQLLIVLGLLKFELESINQISLIASIGLLLGAYTIGGAFDRLSLAWFRLFEKPGTHKRIFEKFKLDHKDQWEITFDSEDFALLMAFIRTKNLDLASEIDRHSAVSIMLRNVSLGMVFLGVDLLIQFLVWQSWTELAASLLLFGVAVLIIREAKTFRDRYYESIYNTTLAYRIDLEKIIKPVQEQKDKV